jgi:hypothetical protein
MRTGKKSFYGRRIVVKTNDRFLRERAGSDLTKARTGAWVLQRRMLVFLFE